MPPRFRSAPRICSTGFSVNGVPHGSIDFGSRMAKLSKQGALEVKNRIIKTMLGVTPFLFIPAILNLIAVDYLAAQNVGVPQSRVAVIDIKYILENHVAFKQQMEGLKVQFDKAGEELKAERMRINELEMKLRELKPSTQDYNQLDEEVNRAKADWSINANKQKKEIRKRESQILWTVYYEVKTVTKRYCEQNRIDLVISFLDNTDVIVVEVVVISLDDTSLFLDAFSHLYRRVCLFVRLSVGPSHTS